ncbi:MAG: putative Ca2+-binding protein [Rhodobacteraceae bacterium HLUCCO07]|nr:MAG: putative Ca2+-binding protein [Rhodobacteraceae bacterium HLUCCO07]
MATASQLSIDTGASADDLFNEIFGEGVTLVSSSLAGDAVQSGIFTGALETLDGISPSDSGVILSTGNATDFTQESGDPNVSAGTSTDTAGGIDGDADMNAVSGVNTFDAVIMEAVFIPDGDYLTMSFVFSSEEYLEYVDGGVNDAFGVWVNGSKLDLSVGSGDVSIDTINDSETPNLYVDNPDADDLHNTEMDGFTVALTLKAPVNRGEENDIKIGLADGGDAAYDSNVLIMGDSVQTVMIAQDDEVNILPDTTRSYDILANDISEYGDPDLTITHINNEEVAVGETVTLPTGEQITLNPDQTVTVQSTGTLGSESFTYGVADSAGNADIGVMTLNTVATLPLDHVVEGTANDDLIDADYTGDPDGDMVDAGDAADGSDNDLIDAGAGHDTVRAGMGDDVVLGGAGDDSVFGNSGDDTLFGGEGDDSLFGELGNDRIEGGEGNDHLEGNEGSDTIFGGAGDDWIRGSYDDDELWGGEGDDYLWGGYGDDLFVIEDSFGNDTIDAENEDEVEGDTLDLSRVTSDLTLDLSHVNPGIGTFTDGTATAEFDGVENIVLGGGRDTLILADLGGADRVEGFEAPVDNGDGTYSGVDMLDVSGMTDGEGNPVNVANVTVTDTNGDGSGDALLEFPNFGESLTLVGVPVSAVGSEAQLIAMGIPDVASDHIVEGTAGDDLINLDYEGDPEGDRIDARDAADGSNDDMVVAGDGDDTIDAGAGDDTIYGGSGDDEIFLDGSIQNDVIHGGETGETLGDRINFSAVSDDITISFAAPEEGTLTDGDSTTQFFEIEEFQMGTGNDSVAGSDGAEKIIGNSGDDTILGGGGDDTIFSGFDDDSVEGGDGDDSILSGAGADTVAGGAGDDRLDLGPDDGDVDLVVLADGSGQDTVSGFEGPIDNGDGTFTGQDRVDVSALNNAAGDPVTTNDVLVGDDGQGNAVLTFPGGETVTLVGLAPGDVKDPAALGAMGIPLTPLDHVVEGTAGDDLIDADYVDDPEGDRVDANDAADGSNDDVIEAGAGDDTVFAGLGDDTVYGGEDNDELFGEAGHDQLFGETGDDRLFGGDGDDSLFAGDGDDVLIGGGGADSLDGGAGADTIEAAEGDVAHGGDGDDLFLVSDLGEPGASTIDIVGGEGDEKDGDTLDFQGLTHWDDVTFGNTEPGAGGGLSGNAVLADGTVVDFSEIENVIICFTAGTRIATARGLCEVQDLQVGEMVLTRDHGLRPLRWVGRRTVPARGSLAPIRFDAGVVANERPLVVSPQHRMLIRSAEASLMFGESEVLASAKHLVNGGSVRRVPGGDVTYVHILFDRHEIVYAEGAPSESFFPGDIGLEAVDAAAREELFTIFPELRSSAGNFGDTARMCLRARESRLLRLE